jgi:hypothetical protein
VTIVIIFEEISQKNMEISMIGAYFGMMMVLIAFSCESRGIISSRSNKYLILMALGEGLLTLRAYVTSEWPFAVLGGIWAIFAVYAIIYPPTK